MIETWQGGGTQDKLVSSESGHGSHNLEKSEGRVPSLASHGGPCRRQHGHR